MCKSDRAEPAIPYLTYCLALISIVIFLIPDGNTLIEYNRNTLPEFQFWRIITFPLAHYSLSHLTMNTIIFAVSSHAVEKSCRTALILNWIISSLLTSSVLFIIKPEIIWFGGYSGLIFSLLTYMSLTSFKKKGVVKYTGIALLITLTVKVCIEFYHPLSFIFVKTGHTPFSPVPEVHLIGILSGILTFFLLKAKKKNVYHPHKNNH